MSEPKIQPADQPQPQPQPASNPGETILYQAPGAEAAPAPAQDAVPAYKPEQPMMADQAAQQQAPPQTSEWNAGLCGCCSPFTSCLLACCAPCIIHGRTADRMRDPTMKTAETFNNDCLISLVLNCAVGCGWIWVMQQRSRIRQQYGIKGSTTSDCCVAYWCPCCSTVQNDKEVVHRTQGLVTDGYQQEGGMQATAQ